jgi:hypothetical protein
MNIRAFRMQFAIVLSFAIAACGGGGGGGGGTGAITYQSSN